jgi:hypothetical protein
MLKYVHQKPSPDAKAREYLAVEAQIYAVIGYHYRIVRLKGGDAYNGFRLESNRSVA